MTRLSKPITRESATIERGRALHRRQRFAHCILDDGFHFRTRAEANFRLRWMHVHINITGRHIQVQQQ